MRRTLALTLVLIIFAALFGCDAEPTMTDPSAEPSAGVSVEHSFEPVVEPSPTPFPTDKNGTSLYRTVEGVEAPASGTPLYSKLPTLEDCLSGKYVIKATFVGDVGFLGKPTSGSYEMEFEVDEVLKGSIDEETISVTMRLGLWKDGAYTIYNYVEGHQYLLIAYKSDSVYQDRVHYGISVNDFLPITDEDLGVYVFGKNLATDDSGFIDREKMLAQMSGRSYIEYIERLCASRPWVAEEEDIPYTTSTDMYEMADECEFALVVTVSHIGRESMWLDAASCICSVDSVIKDTSVSYPMGTGDEIRLMLFTGSVEEDEQYIVMINRLGGADSGSGVYNLAAKTAVYDSSEELIAELKEYLAD